MTTAERCYTCGDPTVRVRDEGRAYCSPECERSKGTRSSPPDSVRVGAVEPVQNHAPPIEGEPMVTRNEYHGPIPRPFEVWTAHGWCSACLSEGVRLVRFGSTDACVGICGECIGRLATEIAEPCVEGDES